MKRSLDSDTEIHLSKKQKRIAKVVPYIQKLPRELLDHIISYISIISHHNVLSYLRYEPWKSDKSRILLWSSIFKSDVWLQSMVEEHNARLVLVGSQLRELSGKKYIILYICNTIRAHPKTWNLFRKCLQNHTVMPNADIIFSSGITLNVQGLLIHHSPPSVLFEKQTQEEGFSFREGKPVIQYSFYETSHIQDLKPRDISIEQGWRWWLQLSDNGIVSPVSYRSKHDPYESSHPTIWQHLIKKAEKSI